MNPFAVFFGCLIGLLVIAVVSFELLLCRLYTDHRAEWVRLDSPFTSCNPGLVGFFSGSFARWRLSPQIFFKKPSWVRGDSIAKIIYEVLRWSTVLMLGGFLGFVVVALVLS